MKKTESNTVLNVRTVYLKQTRHTYSCSSRQKYTHMNRDHGKGICICMLVITLII